MDKKLLATRKEIYGRCPSIFWGVSIFTILLAIALVALEVLVPGLYIATFGLIFFPVLYSAFITLYTIKFGGVISLKSIFVISAAYFKPSAFGCFRLIRNFLFSILAYLIASVVCFAILYPVFESIYGSLFIDSIQQFIDLASSSEEAFIDFISENNPMTLYITVGSSFAFSVGVIYFIFAVSYKSLVVYISANLPNGRANFASSIFGFFLKKGKKEYTRDFFLLNWPMLVLLILGIVVGYVLVFSLELEPSLLEPISSIIGLVFLIPMTPFFFAGMEALFIKYDSQIKNASKDMTLSFLQKIKDQGKLSPDDLAKVNDLLNKQQQSEENKKDSNDGV